ncbi:phospholipase [Thalassomonas viridans]|uniref:Phospholipase n=1 Tax=Thalassomonas viridans TaxID=137584 RepID=A0AAF0C9G2_9GAMM|nr:phospholipase D [Thalassomonas viridans]WDE04859.1 phospholipase [Thalassomonas viridans]
MSQIDTIQEAVKSYFSHCSGPNYVRMLDTPHIWGMPFNKEIMPQARARQAEFERAIVEIVQKARYRCDVSSLNSPDPDWTRAILGAIDTCLSMELGRKTAPQFRFLFGQTPLYPMTPPPNYSDFQGALIRLFRARAEHWEVLPEIWIGRFYRLEKGISSGILAKLQSLFVKPPEDTTKMTWNHSKIIAVDGCEALVGGHNLNMDLFRSYPPVHDASVVVHGDAAHGSQQYLNKMWQCKTDLLTKEYLDIGELVWKNGDDDHAVSRKPADPLAEEAGAAYMKDSQEKLVELHTLGLKKEVGLKGDLPVVSVKEISEELDDEDERDEAEEIRSEDLQTLADLQVEVFQKRIRYDDYDKFDEYKLATRMLSVGKYWTGPDRKTDYQQASEVMKKQLIMGAKRIIRMSQMDLVSAWKKNWSDHVVCHWLMDALLANPDLQVQVVVSPLDAGAGAEGDQYSFGSGACRTFELIKYYMTHDADTDKEVDDSDSKRANALKRLHIAPLYYTDKVPREKTTEGTNYKWPDLTEEGKTASLKQPPLSEKPPKKGVIGSAAWAVVNASGKVIPKVDSAPGNHAKIMVIDDEAYIVGSDNLYPGFLSEFNYLVEGEEAVGDLLKNYWGPLWKYSSPHCANPVCKLSEDPDH